jgi:hypothetical protein
MYDRTRKVEKRKEKLLTERELCSQMPTSTATMPYSLVWWNSTLFCPAWVPLAVEVSIAEHHG